MEARRTRLTTAVFWTYLIVLSLAIPVVAYSLYTVLQTTKRVEQVICNQKLSAENRLVTSVQFLIDHPNGTKDFPVTLIHRSITNAKADVDAAEDVDCPPGPMIPPIPTP